MSLQEIITEVYEDGLSDHIRRELKNHGRTISATEYMKEPDFDRSFGDIETDNYRYDNDDSDGDDYNLDDNSDSRRRAGD